MFWGEKESGEGQASDKLTTICTFLFELGVVGRESSDK